jgi:hypothetical protein
VKDKDVKRCPQYSPKENENLAEWTSKTVELIKKHAEDAEIVGIADPSEKMADAEDVELIGIARAANWVPEELEGDIPEEDQPLKIDEVIQALEVSKKDLDQQAIVKERSLLPVKTSKEIIDAQKTAEFMTVLGMTDKDPICSFTRLIVDVGTTYIEEGDAYPNPFYINHSDEELEVKDFEDKGLIKIKEEGFLTYPGTVTITCETEELAKKIYEWFKEDQERIVKAAEMSFSRYIKEVLLPNVDKEKEKAIKEYSGAIVLDQPKIEDDGTVKEYDMADQYPKIITPIDGTPSTIPNDDGRTEHTIDIEVEQPRTETAADDQKSSTSPVVSVEYKGTIVPPKCEKCKRPGCDGKTCGFNYPDFSAASASKGANQIYGGTSHLTPYGPVNPNMLKCDYCGQEGHPRESHFNEVMALLMSANEIKSDLADRVVNLLDVIKVKEKTIAGLGDEILEYREKLVSANNATDLVRNSWRESESKTADLTAQLENFTLENYDSIKLIEGKDRVIERQSRGIKELKDRINEIQKQYDNDKFAVDVLQKACNEKETQIADLIIRIEELQGDDAENQDLSREVFKMKGLLAEKKDIIKALREKDEKMGKDYRDLQLKNSRLIEEACKVDAMKKETKRMMESLTRTGDRQWATMMQTSYNKLKAERDELKAKAAQLKEQVVQLELNIQDSENIRDEDLLEELEKLEGVLDDHDDKKKSDDELLKIKKERDDFKCKSLNPSLTRFTLDQLQRKGKQLNIPVTNDYKEMLMRVCAVINNCDKCATLI